MTPCPFCADEKGKSIRLVDLTTDPRLILHCENCHQEWPCPAASGERGGDTRSAERSPQRH